VRSTGIIRAVEIGVEPGQRDLAQLYRALDSRPVPTRGK
jgi:hypothetical protein